MYMTSSLTPLKGRGLGVTIEYPSWYRAASVVGAALGAYHGYKRNKSVGWAIGWALLGGAFPIITVPVSLAQGFGKQKGA